MQMDLIERPVITRRTKAEARAKVAAKADTGIQRAADATDARNPGWCELACQALRRFAKHQHGMFIVEHARAVLRSELPPPNDERTWGKVTRMATDRGYIERVKGAYFPAASSNGSEKPVYRKGPKA